jgi:hypothetical protein
MESEAVELDVSAEHACPICTEFLCSPIELPDCGHKYCRLCLLKTTRLAPDGRSCPLCRLPISIKDLVGQESPASLESEIRASVGGAIYDARAQSERAQVEAMQRQANTELPIFAMYPGCRVGDPVLLHFFEPRYKILIRRAWEGNRLFIFCGSHPRSGVPATIVRVDAASFLPDGRANIRGEAIKSLVLGEVWEETGTGRLAYARLAQELTALTPDDRTSASTDGAPRAVGRSSRRSTCLVM